MTKVKNIYMILILIISLTTPASIIVCQIHANDVNGFISEEVIINFFYNGEFNQGETTIFNSDINLSNPTVFFPKIITSSSKIKLDSIVLNRLSDSTYHLSMKIIFNDNFIMNDTLFMLMGELLAGNDSICTLRFSNVFLGKYRQDNFLFNVKSNSPWGNTNYIRFAKILKYYPNPVNTGQLTKCNFIIDKSSNVKIWLYDLGLSRLLLKDYGKINKGYHETDFLIQKSLSAGLYWIGLQTNSGEDYKPLIILK